MCGQSGREVSASTVSSVASIDVKDAKMMVCMNKVCEIVYFGTDFFPLVFNRDIDIDIHFKEESTHHYICYCHKITFDDIKNKVLHHQARSIKDIMPLYCDIILERCEQQHPLGCDCAKDIKRCIESILKEEKLV